MRMPLSKKKKVKKSSSVGATPAPKPRPTTSRPVRDRTDELRAVFSFFDQNQNGNIEADELGTVMASLGYHATDDELRDMIDEADRDGNNMIDFEEFVHLMEEKSKRDQDHEDELKEAFKVKVCLFIM